MAVGGVEVIDLGFVATEQIIRWRFVVQIAGDRQVEMADAAAERVLGVAQHNVSALDAADEAAVNVRMMGISTVEIGAAVALGDYLTTDSVGRAVAVSAAVGLKESAGFALSAGGAAGELIPMVLTPGGSRNTSVT
jgi:hypothetical protein